MAAERAHGQADLTCNKCGLVVQTVPGEVAEQTLIEMSMATGFCAEKCLRCGELNTFPGFDSMLAFICRYCGQGFTVEPPA